MSAQRDLFKCCRCGQQLETGPLGPILCDSCRRALLVAPRPLVGLRDEPRTESSLEGVRRWYS